MLLYWIGYWKQIMAASGRIFQAPKVRRMLFLLVVCLRNFGNHVYIFKNYPLIGQLFVQDMYNSIMDFPRFLRKGEIIFTTFSTLCFWFVYVTFVYTGMGLGLYASILLRNNLNDWTENNCESSWDMFSFRYSNIIVSSFFRLFLNMSGIKLVEVNFRYPFRWN